MRIATGRTGPHNDKNEAFSAVGGGVPDAPQLVCGIPRNSSRLCSSWVLLVRRTPPVAAHSVRHRHPAPYPLTRRNPFRRVIFSVCVSYRDIRS